jgi:Zn-dependent peptidase ImmA (M78 family)
MDEFTVTLKAREFVSKVNPTSVPASMQQYVDQIGATIKVSHDLGDDEDGFSAMKPNGKYGICVNGNQNEKRQRFTVCHELAHIVLGLPSEHSPGPSWSYTKRTPNEILCDVFAAELLLPYKQFKPMVDGVDCSLAAVDELAERFDASVLATASRFATMMGSPCAFVLAEEGVVRFSARSAKMREAKAWIRLGTDLPDESAAKRRREGDASEGPEEVDPEVWFDDWGREGTLYEDARHVAKYDQTIALLWFEEEDVPPVRERRREREEEESGLSELDGVLPWPGSRKRRA